VIFPDRHGDWRWRSWSWLAARAGAWAAALGELPAGGLVGYRWRPAPDPLAADLGIQAAGGLAVPLVEGHEAALPELARWLAVDGERPPEGVTARLVEGPAASAEETGRPAGWRPSPASRELSASLPAEERAAAGGAMTRRHETWERWGPTEQGRAAVLLGRPDPAAGGEAAPHERPIALVAGDLAAAAERAWLAWTLAAGAALVLPGDPAFAAWAIFWPRPTDVVLPADQLTAVRAALATLGRPRAIRRRLGRLRRLLVWGGEPHQGEAAGWEALGVRFQPFPSPGP
jgi:hypothetical protein